MPNWRNLSCYVAKADMHQDQSCLELIFIDCMGLCNYPIALAVPVNQWSASFWSWNAKYTGPECTYAIMGRASHLAAFWTASTFLRPSPNKVYWITARNSLIDPSCGVTSKTFSHLHCYLNTCSFPICAEMILFSFFVIFLALYPFNLQSLNPMICANYFECVHVGILISNSSLNTFNLFFFHNPNTETAVRGYSAVLFLLTLHCKIGNRSFTPLVWSNLPNKRQGRRPLSSLWCHDTAEGSDKDSVQLPPHPQMWFDLSYQCPAADHMRGEKNRRTEQISLFSSN